jgi:hypothetical protein
LASTNTYIVGFIVVIIVASHHDNMQYEIAIKDDNAIVKLSPFKYVSKLFALLHENTMPLFFFKCIAFYHIPILLTRNLDCAPSFDAAPNEQKLQGTLPPNSRTIGIEISNHVSLQKCCRKWPKGFSKHSLVFNSVC